MLLFTVSHEIPTSASNSNKNHSAEEESSEEEDNEEEDIDFIESISSQSRYAFYYIAI